MPNRFMLAPLTNLQSNPDGTLSDDEFRWLTMRAEGGFGATMTCAAHVQAVGQGFPGQLGIFSDAHLPGLTRLAAAIRKTGSLALAQLHHAGIRSPKDLIRTDPVGPSDDAETGARAMTPGEVEQLIDDFASAAERAEKAGFDGVELHGAHGYLLCAFLSAEFNRRDDRYGGSAAARSLVLRECLSAVRQRCGAEFIVGVRLSPERFGIVLPESVELAASLLTGDEIDFLDMSLWDCAKLPADEAYRDRPLIEYFTTLPRSDVRLGVAGKLYSAADIHAALAHGADFVLPGRAAILHHDLPRRVAADAEFAQAALPVTSDYLRNQGLGERFLGYMRGWPGFIDDEAA